MSWLLPAAPRGGATAHHDPRPVTVPPPDPDLTLYPMLAEVLREHDPGGTPMPTLVPGYTDARYFAALGIQTYGFLPMRLPKDITTALIHAPDERIPAEAVEFGASCVYEAIRRYADSL